jgi:HoxN/HupN/NixA family high-affinity nickel-transporter
MHHCAELVSTHVCRCHNAQTKAASCPVGADPAEIGFDTATVVVLLAATAAAATQGLPWYAVLSLPLLFTGAMTPFDTLDGCFMNFAYGWAFARPVGKVYYNLVITGLSIGVAS